MSADHDDGYLRIDEQLAAGARHLDADLPRRWLEARLISLATEANRANLESGKAAGRCLAMPAAQTVRTVRYVVGVSLGGRGTMDSGERRPSDRR